jgi:hypothetical protein
MVQRAHGTRVALGDLQFLLVPLAVAEADGVGSEALLAGNRQAGGGIQPAAIKDNRFFFACVTSQCSKKQGRAD